MSILAPVPVSLWLDKEIILPSQVPVQGQVAFEIPLPVFLPDRRIYVYLEANVSASPGAFALLTEFTLYNKGSVVGALPCRLADFTGLTPNASISRLFNSGGSPVGDSAVLTLAQPFNASITNVTVQPLRISAQCDMARLIVTGVSVGVMTGWRAWAGVLSTSSGG